MFICKAVSALWENGALNIWLLHSLHAQGDQKRLPIQLNIPSSEILCWRLVQYIFNLDISTSIKTIMSPYRSHSQFQSEL